MLRLSRRTRGSFLLNQRVIADWWQPRYRERVHLAAKAKLNAALQESEQAARYGAGEAQLAQDDGSVSTGSTNRNGRAPLSLYEANALAATFVANHNTEDLSATLQYIREHLGEELTPFHYHALLRTFNHNHDLANSVQLLEVMAQSGVMTLESYARMADCVHVSSPADAQARILQIVALGQDAFGSQVMREESGSEGYTVAQYNLGEEGRLARAAEAVAGDDRADRRGSSDETADATTSTAASAAATTPRTTTICSAPVLSSLLHHLSTTCHANTVPSCFLVALWIRALGAELSDWDMLAVLSSVVTHAEDFPRVCALFGHFNQFGRGHVSPQAVADRLAQMNEADLNSMHSEVVVDLTQETVEGTAGNAGRHGSSTHRATSARANLTALVEAMLASLRAAGGSNASELLSQPVSVPFLNAQTNDMSGLLSVALRPHVREGLGAHHYNAGHLLHALSLVHSAVKDDVSAVQTLLWAIHEQERQDAPAKALHAQAATEVASAAADSPGGEPYAVPVHHFIDMGTLFSRMSGAVLRTAQQPFRRSIRQLVNELPSGSAASGAQAALPAACTPPVPTTRDLTKVGNYETQFIRTAAEARAVLRRAVDAGNAAGAGQGRIPGSTQLLFLQLAEFCSRHPPRNPKLTPAGLEERAKWARYLEARDTSLALFGSARQSRESMKHLFYHDNVLPALRSDAVIAKDFSDVHSIFFGNSTASTSGRSQSELQVALLRTRTTLPHTGSSEATVPQYLWDPAVYNPYPAALLPNNTAAGQRADGTLCGSFGAEEILSPGNTVLDALGEDAEASEASEFFVELWHALLDKTTSVGSNEIWYLQNSGMYLQLVRCLLHRLDWEAAVHLTRKMSQHATYTYFMDHELTGIFREIGDPAGCLAFKVATKLFDGRITKDGQTKREKFHQEQFQ